MVRLTRSAFLVLMLMIPSGSPVLAQDQHTATPVPRIDICASFADAATPAAGSAVQIADATFDLAYVDMMITSHQNTIIMLLIAEDRAEHPELIEFVADVLAERRGTIESLLGWRSEHFGGAPFVASYQAMEIFDATAAESPGRGGVAGAREIAAEPHIEELCDSDLEAFDLTLIDHLLTQISAELLLSSGAETMTTDPALSATARDLTVTLQRELDALYAWRTLWYPDAEAPHAH
jgi:uncharacterized protein (DUF305 family)